VEDKVNVIKQIVIGKKKDAVYLEFGSVNSTTKTKWKNWDKTACALGGSQTIMEARME
jgi:hypothetical protein